MNTDSKTEIGDFFNAWITYQKVLENNYMYHQEIYQAVDEFMRGQVNAKPFKLLDLGCGDASFLTNAINGTAISHYPATTYRRPPWPMPRATSSNWLARLAWSTAISWPG